MEKIAVIGLSCLFPEAKTPQEFWQNLMEQKDSRTPLNNEKIRLNVNEFYDPKGDEPHKFYCMRGGYIDNFEMDYTGLHLSEESLEGLDNVYLWPLHVAREALRDSGYWGNADVLARCGLILGNLSMPTKFSNYLFFPIYHETIESCLRELLGNKDFHLSPFSTTEKVSKDNIRTAGYPSALIAKALSLSGVHLTLDAACASSLYSVRLACDYLMTRKADVMLAGAVSAADIYFVHMGFSVFYAYPREGEHSSPLDKNSTGLNAGQGAGMFVLKRYSDALRDGDRIHAVILGGGLSNDGRGQSVLSPNSKGQIIAFEKAYANAGVDPRSIQFVECHATGTSLGDKVELDSMDTFFGKYGAAPLVGAVKSNLGHLLTAAGMPAMTKVILSMIEGVIPATINVKEPQTSQNKVIDTHQIPTSSVPWPDSGSVKRAAVSAFGLGGTDAHLIFERDEREVAEQTDLAGKPSAKDTPRDGTSLSPMAIVGMDALFGSCRGLSAFHRSTYDGTQHFISLPTERWKGIETQLDLLKRFGFEDGQAPLGAYIDRFDMDFLRAKIPPNEDDRLIPQQLLPVKITDNALQQAQVEPGEHVAVIIAMEAELAAHLVRGSANLLSQFPRSFSQNDSSLSPAQKKELLDIIHFSLHKRAKANQYTSYVGNIMASRVSSLWDFTGPSFTVSSEENSVYRALEIAQMMLDSGDVQAVVVGAVDLAGGVENVLWRNRENKVNTGEYTLSFDQNVDGWMIGEGCGAVVLKRLDVAKQNDEHIYASIDTIASAKGVSQESVAQACQQAFEKANIEASSIGYLEVYGSGLSQEDEEEMAGLIQAYKTTGPDLRCAMGSVKANIGHTFAASGMASLIKTALCIHHRYIPQTPAWSAPKHSGIWQQSPFYVPTKSRTWFLEGNQQKRIAALNGLGRDGVSTHVILSEEPDQKRFPSTYLVDTPFSLLPLAGEDQVTLQNGLDELKQEILSGSPVSTVATHCFERCQRHAEARYALAIVGNNREEIIQEIDTARTAIEKVFATGRDWSSLRGSCFTANPLGKKGKIAFVYPGGLNSYPGFGQDLFQLFPQMHEEARKYTSQLGQMGGEKLLYPRSIRRLSKKDLNALDQDLMNTPITMFETGILFAILYTKIVRSVFGIEPQIALGYSMGEVSMMYALGVWGKTDEMSSALRSSPVFQTRLVGPMEAVREAWNIPEADDRNEKIWYCYVLRIPADSAREALEGESRAYLIFINSPNEVIIAGEDHACKRVIEKLACECFELPMSDAIHCEIAAQEHDELARMHNLPVNDVTGIDFYSADRFAPLPIDSNMIANNIATIYSHEIDFSRLVQQVYEDGARIFIELGPRENCTNWIGETLGERSHLAAGVNRKGVNDKTSLLRALAKLYAHRVDLDLTPLYARPEIESTPKKTFVQPIVLGGVRIPSAILNEENKKRFKAGQPAPDAKRSVEPLEVSLPLPEAEKVHGDLAKPPRVDLATPKVQERAQGTMRTSRPDSTPAPFNQFDQNRTLLGSSHSAFLNARREGLQKMGEMIQLQMKLAVQTSSSASESAVSRPPAPLSTPDTLRETIQIQPPPDEPSISPLSPIPASLPKPLETPERSGTPSFLQVRAMCPQTERPPATRTKPTGVIWDYEDLREFAEGKIANVFGEEYASIDTYRKRVRLPTEPYLLVSRVTKLDAERGVFRPSSLTTEYDIPYNAWYSIDGHVPWAVAVESGQCDLLLISYLGIDFECKGERGYRLLDCTITFLDDVAQEGDTLRFDIKINSFARSGGTLLFFFSYDCYVKDKLTVEMRGGCAGFFTDQELVAGKGVILTEAEIEERKKIQKKRFDPLLSCLTSRFEREDLLKIIRGDLKGCFGPAYDQGGLNPSLRFTAEPMLMLDRIVSVDPRGGAWGLGLVVAEKDLAPDHWYFPCHFKDDQVLAGSLMSDACNQLLRFYMLYFGMQTCTEDAQFQPVLKIPQKVRCRGQVIPTDSLLTYRMEVKEIGTEPEPYTIADVDILLDDKTVVAFENLGVRLATKEVQGAIPKSKPPEPKGTLSYNEMLRTYPPPERRQTDEARPPGVLLDYTDLREFAEGKIANVFGDEYAPIDTYHRRARLPMEPFLFVSRVLSMDAERGTFRPCSITTEYDIPENPWYAIDGQVPWAIIVEASHCDLLLMGYLGIDFESKGDRVFRVVEVTMNYADTPVFAGDTIRMEVKIHSFVRTAGTLLLFNSYDCYKGDKLIATMRDGCVGFFTDQQVACGKGIVLTEAEMEERKGIQKKRFDPLLRCDKSGFERADLLELVRHNEAGCFGPAYDRRNLNPSLSFAAEPSLMIDRVVSVEPGGGAWGLGLVVAEKDLAPDHWYFPCHFKDDPVLAGTLIGEGCVQVAKFYMLFLGLQTSTQDAVFQPLPGRPQKVRCRGQVTPKDPLLTYRMEVKEIGVTPDPYLIADIQVLLGDRVILEFRDIAGWMSPLIEK